MCPACYKPDAKGYCLNCRKILFAGSRVSPFLNFDSPKAGNLPAFQEKTKRLSISGVQLKYSLLLDGNELKLTERGGQYLLKPIPPSTFIDKATQAPENEHLTMQIASQIFNMETAPNALIYFKDGAPAYLTRRFDVNQHGSKLLQEDMAQVSGQSRHTFGENFKYEGSYEKAGQLIRQHAAAYYPSLEKFFKLILFNYIFSNGDAHLKNFSLLRTSMGDYTLAPAYDLMSTVLHTPHESDTALNLYDDDLDSEYYTKYGCYGQPNFRELAKRIGLMPARSSRIISQLLLSRDKVETMVKNSFLEEETKVKFLSAYRDKLRRMGLTASIISNMIDPKTDDMYAPTFADTKLVFRDGSIKVGYFQERPHLAHLKEENKYTFVEKNNKDNFRETSDDKYVTQIDGDDLVNVEYPAT